MTTNQFHSLPNQVDCKDKNNRCSLKIQTVSSSCKPRNGMDNDASIQMPPFIESGDEIILDTRTLEYIKKFNNMNSISANLNVMIKASEKASKILIRDFGEIEKLQVSKKSQRDFITNADLKIEKIIIEELGKARPNFSFISEERGQKKK